MSESTNNKVKPALIGGASLGVASGIPFLNVLNCACCALVVGGGFLAAWLYLKDQPPSPEPPWGDGAIVGLLAGLFGAAVAVVVDIPFLAMQSAFFSSIDFSEIALKKAEARAAEAGVGATFVQGDLTAVAIPGVEGPFDFIVDFGTLDDLKGESRQTMARTITRLSRPGTVFLEYCFYGETEELPWISFKGTSKMSHIAPGELETLFGDDWEVEPFS